MNSRTTTFIILMALMGCRAQDTVALKSSHKPPWGPGVPPALLASPRGESAAVSVIQLIGNPEAFEGKRVRVVGFANIEFEIQGLFLHREDFDHAILKNALWLDVPLKPEFIALNGRYVIVEGTFTARIKGHFSGAIVDVSRYDPMPTLKELRNVPGTRP